MLLLSALSANLVGKVLYKTDGLQGSHYVRTRTAGLLALL